MINRLIPQVIMDQVLLKHLLIKARGLVGRLLRQTLALLKHQLVNLIRHRSLVTQQVRQARRQLAAVQARKQLTYLIPVRVTI
jgi:NAD dependent epimerase/dehydratase family enzyme